MGHLAGSGTWLRSLSRSQIRPYYAEELYQLYAFFNSADEVTIEAPLPGSCCGSSPAAGIRTPSEKNAGAGRGKKSSVCRQSGRRSCSTPEAHRQKIIIWDRAWKCSVSLGAETSLGPLEGLSIVMMDPAKRTQRQRDRLQD